MDTTAVHTTTMEKRESPLPPKGLIPLYTKDVRSDPLVLWNNSDPTMNKMTKCFCIGAVALFAAIVGGYYLAMLFLAGIQVGIFTGITWVALPVAIVLLAFRLHLVTLALAFWAMHDQFDFNTVFALLLVCPGIFVMLCGGVRGLLSGVIEKIRTMP